ncbi:metabotropic glutamate receptor 4-like isoform X2 [Dendronephthya gigantea]|uniref:metabotropic glutamate receptor 4-like isoform X2 n=1 Tax=Dendronephthya gigantea TaxID=151771 RepID=UPI0010693C38|nr:metabotropic glutamate receptor 4-like isoform X2 [Dendronephthya gigantea]
MRYILQTSLYILTCLELSKCRRYTLEQHLKPHMLMQSDAHSNENDMLAAIDGDLILGGLFSLHRRYLDMECYQHTSPRNIMRVEAMLYAVEEINNDTSILPNITLGAEIRDDCLSDNAALDESLKFVLNAFGQGGKICTDPDNLPPPVMGVVGTVSSQTSITVASLLRLFRLPQVSYGATSPDLSNRDEFGYFARTVPSDDGQAKALVDIITQLGWSAFFLISSSGNYGERIRECFLDALKNDSPCIVDELKIGAPEGDGSLQNSKQEREIEAFLERINKRQSVRGVVLLTESVHTYVILKTVKKIQNKTMSHVGGFRWLATDTWGVGQELRGVEDIADGAISIALHRPRLESLEKFYQYFRALRPGANPRNPWFDMFWESHFKCVISKNSTNAGKYATLCNETEASAWDMIGFTNDDKVPYVFDAVYALGHSLDAMLRTTNKSLSLRKRLDQLTENGIDLFEYLKNTSFTGKSGNVSFDENGNGMSRYDIMFYEKREYSKITEWSQCQSSLGNTSWFENRKRLSNHSSWCSKECKIGEARIVEPGNPRCCWKCEPCRDKEYVDSDFSCRNCALDSRPTKNRTGCERLPEDGPTPWVIVLLTIWASLGILCTLFVALTMYKFYSTPLIMASGRELMLVLLAGIALSFCLGFAMLGEPSRRRCVFQRFGSGVFLAVCYSAILVKTNRIARIFRGRHRPAFITPGPQLLITALLVCIQVGISLIASMFGTTSELTKFYEPRHFHLICRTSGMEYIISISYNVLLLVLCTIYAFLTRKLPANFNEAKLVGITMYTTCVQWICFLPLFYGTKAVYRTSVLLLNSCFNATVLLAGMFGQKVYVVWFRPEKNTRQASNPRGRNGSTTSVSGNSMHMDEKFQTEKGAL